MLSQPHLKTLQDIPCSHATVFLRCDLNMPLHTLGDTVTLHKLEALQPTIDFLLQAKARIVLATHLGRPTVRSDYEYHDTLSTKHLVALFRKLGYDVAHADISADAPLPDSRIILLENLRFFAGECKNNLAFAQKLARYADIYVNDAFGSLHRKATSLHTLPLLFDKDKRAIGLLVASEIEALWNIKYAHEKPYMLLLGGAKVITKLECISGLVTLPKKLRPASIFLGGLLAHTVLDAQGLKIGHVETTETLRKVARNILEQAHDSNVNIILPEDVVCFDENSTTKIHEVGQLPPNAKAVDIGPQTIDAYRCQLKKARTLVVNGTMGLWENPAARNGTRLILDDLISKSMYCLIGGGDAVHAARFFGVSKRAAYCSTGGGCTLSFLASQPGEELRSLPTLEPFLLD